jgi:hypothetical protein
MAATGMAVLVGSGLGVSVTATTMGTCEVVPSKVAGISVVADWQDAKIKDRHSRHKRALPLILFRIIIGIIIPINLFPVHY